MDKFHAENTYVICLSDDSLAGMLAMRAERPFSLDHKLPDLDSYLPADRKICEIRLLAVDKRFRGAQVLQGMLALVWQHGVEQGYDLAKIPFVVQYNKRDLPNIIPINELRQDLNPGGVPDFEACASTGEGVFETLKAVAKLILIDLKKGR